MHPRFWDKLLENRILVGHFEVVKAFFGEMVTTTYPAHSSFGGNPFSLFFSKGFMNTPTFLGHATWN